MLRNLSGVQACEIHQNVQELHRSLTSARHVCYSSVALFFLVVVTSVSAVTRTLLNVFPGGSKRSDVLAATSATSLASLIAVGVSVARRLRVLRSSSGFRGAFGESLSFPELICAAIASRISSKSRRIRATASSVMDYAVIGLRVMAPSFMRRMRAQSAVDGLSPVRSTMSLKSIPFL
jgi:hypothetical protein